MLLHPYNETTVERPGAARGAGAAHRARDQSPARHADGRLHHDPRSRHRRRRLRRRRAEAGRRPGHHPRPAHARRRRARSSRPAATARRASRSSGACRRAPRRPTATTLVRVVRDQIGHGADWIKVYADYRWGAHGEAAPTFSLEELKTIVETARSSGRPGRRAREHGRGHAPRRSWPASRRSSTATPARRRSSS